MFDSEEQTLNKQNCDRGLAGARPLIKWAGGKARLLSQLAELMPAGVVPGFDGRLIEPFVGGAAMFLWMRPRQALLADANPELIGLYEAVKRSLPRLIAELDKYQDLPHNAEVYYEHRRTQPQDRVARAAWLIYLNRNCFNGLYRLNKKGEFNVPFGRYKTKPRLYESANLEAVHCALQSAELAVLDFQHTLERVKPGDFVYLDPPYYPLSQTSSFTGYTGAGFGHKQQVQLRDALLDANERLGGKAHFMLSNSSAEALLNLYRPYPEVFRIHTVTATRAVGAQKASRGSVEEVAILNYDV